MFTIGQSVKVLAPFAEFFPGVYTISQVINSEDGTTTYILDGADGGFDSVYLELA